MLLKQKRKLAEKLSKIHLRIQSQAFSKIFMIQQKTFKKIQKLRHYDIQMEAVSAITSWLKKKCQVEYLKGFYQIKSCIREKPSIKELGKQFKKTSKYGYASKTDRVTANYEAQKFDTKSQYKNNTKSVCYGKSMTDRGQQKNQQTKSNLAYLLNKVKQVNNDNRMIHNFKDKQNNYIQNHSTIRIDEDDYSQIKLNQYKLKQRLQNYCKTQQSKYRNVPKISKRQQIISKIKQLQSTLTTMKDDIYCPDLSQENESIYCQKYSHAYSQHGNSKYYQLRKYSKN